MERKLIWFVALLGLVIAAVASVSSALGGSHGSMVTLPACKSYPEEEVADAAYSAVKEEIEEWVSGDIGRVYIGVPEISKCSGARDAEYTVKIVATKPTHEAACDRCGPRMYYRIYTIATKGLEVVGIDMEEGRGIFLGAEHFVGGKVFKSFVIGEKCEKYSPSKVALTAYEAVKPRINKWLSALKEERREHYRYHEPAAVVALGYPESYGNCEKGEQGYIVKIFVVLEEGVVEIVEPNDMPAVDIPVAYYEVKMKGLTVEEVSEEFGTERGSSWKEVMDTTLPALIPKVYKQLRIVGGDSQPRPTRGIGKIYYVDTVTHKTIASVVVVEEGTSKVVASATFKGKGKLYFSMEDGKRYVVMVAAQGYTLEAKPFDSLMLKKGVVAVVSEEGVLIEGTVASTCEKCNEWVREADEGATGYYEGKVKESPREGITGSKVISALPVKEVATKVARVAREKFGKRDWKVKRVEPVEIADKPFYKAIVERPIKLFNIIPLPWKEEKVIYVSGEEVVESLENETNLTEASPTIG